MVTYWLQGCICGAICSLNFAHTRTSSPLLNSSGYILVTRFRLSKNDKFNAKMRTLFDIVKYNYNLILHFSKSSKGVLISSTN